MFSLYTQETGWILSEPSVFTQDWPNFYRIPRVVNHHCLLCLVFYFVRISSLVNSQQYTRMSSRNCYKCKQVGYHVFCSSLQSYCSMFICMFAIFKLHFFVACLLLCLLIYFILTLLLPVYFLIPFLYWCC